MRELVEQMGLSAGQKVSPPLFESLEVIGRDKVLERIQHGAG